MRFEIALSFTVLAAFGLIELACSGGGAPMSTAVPTDISAAKNLSTAINHVEQTMLSLPPYTLVRPEDFVYVETTQGQARELLAPERDENFFSIGDETPVWVFLASGQFASYNRFSGETRSFTKFCFVVPEIGRGQWPCEEAPELNALGAVKQVPKPWPTREPRSLQTPTPIDPASESSS